LSKECAEFCDKIITCKSASNLDISIAWTVKISVLDKPDTVYSFASLALDKYSKNVSALISLCTLYTRRGKSKEASEYLAKAESINAKNKQVVVLKAIKLQSEKQYDVSCRLFIINKHFNTKLLLTPFVVVG